MGSVRHLDIHLPHFHSAGQVIGEHKKLHYSRFKKGLQHYANVTRAEQTEVPQASSIQWRPRPPSCQIHHPQTLRVERENWTAARPHHVEEEGPSQAFRVMTVELWAHSQG